MHLTRVVTRCLRSLPSRNLSTQLRAIRVPPRHIRASRRNTSKSKFQSHSDGPAIFDKKIDESENANKPGSEMAKIKFRIWIHGGMSWSREADFVMGIDDLAWRKVLEEAESFLQNKGKLVTKLSFRLLVSGKEIMHYELDCQNRTILIKDTFYSVGEGFSGDPSGRLSSDEKDFAFLDIYCALAAAVLVVVSVALIGQGVTAAEAADKDKK